MPGHQIVDFTRLQTELNAVVFTSCIYRYQLRTGQLQDVERSAQGCTVFNRFVMSPVHIPVSEPDAPPCEHLGSGKSAVIAYQRHFNHHRPSGLDTTQSDE